MPSNAIHLLAGASQIDITPPLGTQLAGDVGRHRPAEVIRDNLYARILVLRHNTTTICNVACDVIGITAECSTPLRKEIADFLGTTPDGVMINAQQSHATPCVGNHMIKTSPYIKDYPWLGGGDRVYETFFSQQIIKGVREACQQFYPVILKAGRSTNARVAFNRRFILRDGTASNQPSKAEVPQILCCEGPIDPEVGLVVLEAPERKKNIACLIHYTAHPCHGFPGRWVSADWPGLWCQAVSAHFKCPTLMFNGFCGNVITFNYTDREEHFYDMHADVAALMQTTRKIIPDLQPISCLPLCFASKKIAAKMRPLSPSYLSQAKTLLEEHPTPIFTAPDNVAWDWVFAVMCQEYHAYAEKHNYMYPIELQCFRIGDFSILGCPAEPYVEAQLAIKMNSPAKFLFCAHETNDIFAYIPTKAALERPCRSTNQWQNLSPVIAKFVPDTLDLLVEQSRNLIQSLYQAPL